MPESLIYHTLFRLWQAANQVSGAWPMIRWTKIAGPGPDFLDQDASGTFNGLRFEPGQDLSLATRLNLPAQVAGVPLAGDPLEATIFSLYPAEFTYQDESVFCEDGVPVAAGPALVTLIPRLHEGDNGELHILVHIPRNQTTPWFQVRFTTPGLRARFELLDLAWAELAWANALALTREEKAVVTRAASLVPEDLAAFSTATLQRIEGVLAPLSTKASKYQVHVIGHSHIDMNWLWTWEDTNNVILRDFKSVLSLMDEYPELTFTYSQPATYEIIRIQAPELFERVVAYIHQGRWEPATLTWVEGDTNMASGEALARHLLESVQFSRQYLHFWPTTFLAPDTFGHAGNLPQLAASAGAIRYYHHRCNPDQADRWPAYWWEGQDGTRLLAISTASYNGEIRARDLVESALHACRHSQRHSLHFHGIGDHGGGPARQNLEALRRFQQHPLLPAASCSTLARYTQCLLDSGVALPVQRGESSTIFEGCYTTHADIKRYNRLGENLLCTADTLIAVAGLPAASIQGEPPHRLSLQSAWRKLLFNQFHDILDGSGIHETYQKCAEDFAEIAIATAELTEQALSALQSGLPAGLLAVTNPLGWERQDWVTVPEKKGSGSVWLIDSQGHRTLGQYTPDGLGFVARVPAFGTVSYQSDEATAFLDGLLSAEGVFSPLDNREIKISSDERQEPPYYKIDTPFFRIYLRRDSGILVSFYDKRVGRELVAYGLRRASDYLDSARADLALNVLQLDQEHSHGMSAWHLDEVHTTHSLLSGAVTRLVEEGPARLVFSVEHVLQSSTIHQVIIFYRDLPRVDFCTRVNWQELGGLSEGIPNLKVAFTARFSECQAWFETPFAAVQRPCDGQEVPALRWADVGGEEYGMALINDSKYGYDVLGTRLRLTLLRSSYEPDSISDVGQHEIHYSFYPHPGNWRTAGVVRAAAGINQPLLGRLVSHGQPLVLEPWRPQILGSPSIIPACLKTAYQGTGRVLRLYESGGQAGEVELSGFPSGCRVWETTLTEDKLSEFSLVDGRLRLAFRPWRVRTLLIE
jgi:alpha-mannosidase